MDNRTQVILRRGSGFKRVDTIYGAFNVVGVAVAKAINGKPCTVHVLSGNLWINPLDTAVADDTAIKLSAASGSFIDLTVETNLSCISDVTGATAQIIVWGD
jgi:hypothetical protein